MRAVTFQSKDITDKIVNNGFIETVLPFGCNVPYGIRRIDYDERYVRIDDGRVMDANNLKGELIYEFATSNKKDRIFPFYAYTKHRYCGDMCNMSVHTIYHLASHFMASMGFDRRDIIELEVPDDEILDYHSNSDFEECVLPYIKKEWIVSILHFKDYDEDVIYHETSNLYENEVFNDDTYRMCYAKSLLLTGHSYGDNVAFCMRSDLIPNISCTEIQRDYVQPVVWNLFKKYLYLLRHDKGMSDIVNVKGNIATIEMPAEFDTKLIKSFNVCKAELLNVTNSVVYDEGTSYKERIPLIIEQNRTRVSSLNAFCD